MFTDLRPLRRIGALSALVAVVLGTASVGRAEDTPPAATARSAEHPPAMQGHDAEAKMRAPDAEARWRRLFFDAAIREAGEAQVSCDHRVARRPDLDGGPAVVTILWDPARGRVLERRWATSDGGPIDLAAAMRRLGEAAPPGTEIDGLAFRRCR